MRRAAAIARAILKGKNLPPLDLTRSIHAKRVFLRRSIKDASGAVHLVLVDGSRAYVATIDLGEIRNALGRHAGVFKPWQFPKPTHFLTRHQAAAMVRNGLAPASWLEEKEEENA